MKTEYHAEDNLLHISDSAPSKDESTLLDEWLVTISFPDYESRVIVGLEVVHASHFFAKGYDADTDIWTFGNVQGADLVEEHGDFVGYWQKQRFDDGDAELSPIGVELRRVSKHIPIDVCKAMRRRQWEYENANL